MNTTPSPALARRRFLQLAGSAAAATSLGLKVTPARAAGPDTVLKIGLVGCGGRGTGAAAQALTADGHSVLHAVGDAFENRLENSLRTLAPNFEGRIHVDDSRKFTGLDAYKGVIDSGVDVVLLTTPPAFRPAHFEYAVKQGKHIFAEKPVSVDVPGAKRILATLPEARARNLSIVSGFCWRYSDSRREAFSQIHEGAIGDINSYFATYYAGPVNPYPAGDEPGSEPDLARQLRYWQNFIWLSGDSLVEQAVHSVDKISWAMHDRPPLACVATGGRQQPAHGGNIFDHFHIAYEYDDLVFCHLGSRQQSGCHTENSDYVRGSKGSLLIGRGPAPIIRGETSWRFRGEDRNMYQVEHDELFAAIRSGERVDDTEWMTQSTLLAIMGRTAAYTGQRIQWDEFLKDEQSLVPDDLDWNTPLPVAPRPIPGRG